MKRSLTLLLASLLVVLGLTACGGGDDNKQNDSGSAVVDGSAGSGNAESGTGQEDRPESGSTDHAARPDDGDSLMEDAEQGVEKAVRGAEDLMDDAMRGGRTRDRNGDLTDPENGVARNSTR